MTIQQYDQIKENIHVALRNGIGLGKICFDMDYDVKDLSKFYKKHHDLFNESVNFAHQGYRLLLALANNKAAEKNLSAWNQNLLSLKRFISHVNLWESYAKSPGKNEEPDHRTICKAFMIYKYFDEVAVVCGLHRNDLTAYMVDHHTVYEFLQNNGYGPEILR